MRSSSIRLWMAHRSLLAEVFLVLAPYRVPEISVRSSRNHHGSLIQWLITSNRTDTRRCCATEEICRSLRSIWMTTTSKKRCPSVRKMKNMVRIDLLLLRKMSARNGFPAVDCLFFVSVYPGLEFSDDDEDVIQKLHHRRGDPKDSTWNPRGNTLCYEKKAFVLYLYKYHEEHVRLLWHLYDCMYDHFKPLKRYFQ